MPSSHLDRTSPDLARGAEVVEASPVPSALVGFDGALVVTNRAFRRLLGRGTRVTSWWALFPSTDLAEVGEAGVELSWHDGRAIRWGRAWSAPPRLDLGGRVVSVVETTAARDEVARLRHATEHDGLTGLWNRARLRSELGRLVRRDHHLPAAVLAIDLDQFKRVNDTFGHASGDRLLCRVAQAIGSLREPGDGAARVSGDEFAVILVGGRAARLEVATTELARRIGEVEVEVPGGATIRPSASVGAAPLPASIGGELGAVEAAVDAVLHAADLAMYRSKPQRRRHADGDAGWGRVTRDARRDLRARGRAGPIG